MAIHQGSIEQELIEQFKTRKAGPFLFVGSGFSRRYLALDDWAGLLSRFSVAGKPFEYYVAAANGDYPAAAGLLAKDFNEHWWAAKEYKPSVEKNKAKVKNISSALRLEICSYLTNFDQGIAKKSEYAEEVQLLSSLNVDGIITTNWDQFLEEVFPDYKTYIGQKELLFSNPQQIGEIYKIHGCSSIPESLVLTDEDYMEFNERNAYLAAKLITIFVEHPIIFLGYSLSDQNISNLLRAISLCIGKENIEQLRKNLIFVQRLEGDEKEALADTYLAIDGVQIPLVLVKTNDFAGIYRALGTTKRQIPARILRYCKEQLYELVKSAHPEKKLSVLDIDAIDKKEDVEFLVGVGVASQAGEVGNIGYEVIEIKDLINDLLHETKGYDAQKIVENVLKRAGRNTQNVPVFKYLRAIGVDSKEKYVASGLKLDKWVYRELKEFRVKMYAKPFYARRHQSMEEIISSCTPENASTFIPFLSRDKIDLDLLRDFLIANEEKLDLEISNYASYFRKLAALYDRLKWGW